MGNWKRCLSVELSAYENYSNGKWAKYRLKGELISGCSYTVYFYSSMLSNPLTFTLAESWLWLKLSTCKGVQAESANCSVFLHFFSVMLCINNNGSSEILSKVDLYYDYTHSSWKVYFVWVNQSSNIRILHESVSLLTFASCMSQSVF